MLLHIQVMKKQQKVLVSLFVRYILILIAGAGNLFIFYKTLTPATINVIAGVLRLFTETAVLGNFIIMPGLVIEIIPACVAGSAYYLLFILTLSVPKIKISKRIKILAFNFVLLFVLNIFRILILSLTSKTIYFNATHLIFWYLISTIFVVGIWIASVKVFKIKSIPVYDDFRFLWGLVKKK